MLRLLAILLLLHVYIGARVVPDLALGVAGTIFSVLALAALFTVMPLALIARRIERQPLADRIAMTSFVAMGVFSSLLVLTLLRDLSLLVPLPATYRTYSAAAVPALAVFFTIVGFFNARRRARVRRVEIPIANLPAALRGFTIAQITDIHVGPTIKRDYVEAIVDAVNALRPDVIAVTGDLVDGPVGQLAEHTQPFARLTAPHGVYFVTGNHADHPRRRRRWPKTPPSPAKEHAVRRQHARTVGAPRWRRHRLHARNATRRPAPAPAHTVRATPSTSPPGSGLRIVVMLHSARRRRPIRTADSSLREPSV